MNIDEIIKAKKEMQSELGHMIVKFEKETHTKIEEIRIDRIHVSTWNEPYKEELGEIQIKLVIP